MADWMAIKKVLTTEGDWVYLMAQLMAMPKESHLGCSMACLTEKPKESRLGCSMAEWMAIEMVELTERDWVQLMAQWMARVRDKAVQLHHMPSV